MDYRIEMSVKPQWQDARGQGVVRRLSALPGLPPVRGIRTRSVYTVSANITPDEAEKVAHELADPVTRSGIVGAIIVESVEKFFNPTEVNGTLIIWTAAVGIVINGLTAWALSRQQKHDINTRGAFLHMLADTLVSVGVVISGVVIKYTGWTVVDPIIGLVIAVVILVSTWELLSESLRMSTDAVPEGFDVDDISHKIESLDGVLNVHHMHIWAISTTETALTCHIVIPEATMLEEVTDRVKETLDGLGIHHSTLEMETRSSHCKDHDCC